jgi:hypothetical protein
MVSVPYVMCGKLLLARQPISLVLLHYVREIAVGQATNFIGTSGLDPGAGAGAGAQLLFAFDGDPGCWIDGALAQGGNERWVARCAVLSTMVTLTKMLASCSSAPSRLSLAGESEECSESAVACWRERKG